MALSTFLTDFSLSDDLTASVTNDLNSGSLTLTSLVETLGPALTHKEADKRQKGLQLLSSSLEGLKSELTAQECHFIVAFYVDRLKDSSIMYSACLEAFHTLTTRHGGNMEDADWQKMLNSMLTDLHTQSFVVSERTKVFDCLSFALTNKLPLLSSDAFSSQFVLGFLQAVEGETGPKNLKVIFNCWPVVIRKLDCKMFLEDIFEALACYFPIDFDQPKGGGNVTKEDLSGGLKECLKASPSFAEFAIPLFLEKLSSDVADSKVEALVCYEECLRAYSPLQLQKHLKETWGNCKQEIMGIRANTNETVISKAFGLLRSLSMRLCDVTQSPENATVLQTWIELVWGELKPFLKFLESGLMETAVDILTCLCSADKLISEPLVNLSLPILLEVYESHDDKLRIIRMSTQILSASHKLKSPPDWCDQLVKICQGNLIDEALAGASVKLLCKARILSDRDLYAAIGECFDRFMSESGSLEDTERIDLALVAAEVDLDRVEKWWKVQVPLKEFSNVPVLSALSCKSKELLQSLIPELAKEENLAKDATCLKALQTIWKQCDLFESKAELLSLVVKDHKIIPKMMAVRDRSAIETAEAFIVDIGREMTTDLQSELENLPAVTAENHSRFAAFVIALPGNVLRQISGLKEILNAEHSDKDLTMKVRASIVNKVPSAVGEMSSSFSPSEFTPSLAWVVKGLLMRGAKESKALLDTFLQQFQTFEEAQANVRRDIEIILGENDLSAPNHHKALPFYKQKFFLSTHHALLERFNEDRTRLVCLDAILYQLPFVPRSVIETELSPLIPKLVGALFDDSSSRVSPALSSFLGFVKSLDQSVLNSTSEKMIPFLLKVACSEEAGIKEAVDALETVGSTASEDVPKDLRALVIAKLAGLLNHRKRLVRRAAAEARNAWMLL